MRGWGTAHYIVYGRELGAEKGRGEKLKTTAKHDLSLPIMRFGKVGPFFSIKRMVRGGKRVFSIGEREGKVSPPM